MSAKVFPYGIRVLEDERGPYGVGAYKGEQPYAGIHYRPDMVVNGSPQLKAALHAIPRTRFECVERDIIGQFVSFRSAELRARPTFKQQKTRLENLRFMFGVQASGRRAFNACHKVAIASADQAALHLAYRFPVPNRFGIYKAASHSRRAFQLAEAFPLLAVYLYSSDARYVEVDEQRAMVERGAKLRDIADSIRMPIALRKIKPGACLWADRCMNLLVNRDADIHAFLPATTLRQQRWLRMLLACGHDNDFLRWAMRRAPLTVKVKELGDLVHDVKDWARAHRGQFHPNMSWDNAKRASDDWHGLAHKAKRGELVQFDPPWLPGSTVDGFDIVPLTDTHALHAEGKAMHHCVGGYSSQVIAGYCYIYSVRRDGKPVATAEIAPNNDGFMVQQLRGPCNRKVDPDLERATAKWLTRATRSLGRNVARRLVEKQEVVF